VGRRGPGRPPGSATAGKARRRSGRRNTRADQAVKLIKANPGMTAAEAAKKMRIKPNYLYRVLGDVSITAPTKLHTGHQAIFHGPPEGVGSRLR
jgi:hypothetical protein